MTARPSPPLEVVTMGRVGVDLYPEQLGVPLAGIRSFVKSLGGSPTNVAVAAARLGRRVAVITKVGADGFGTYVRDALQGFGVWPGWVSTDPDYRTPVVFAEAYPPDRFPMLFYREPRAPDSTLESIDFDADALATVPVLWVTGQGLSREPSRSTTLDAMRRRRGRLTVLDIDHRDGHWPSREEESAWLAKAAEAATAVVGNQQEVGLLVDDADPLGACRALHELGPDLAVVKLGPAGSCASRRGEGTIRVPGFAVQEVCGLGAGDAFGGALVDGLLAERDLTDTLRFANAAGALVASRLACADAMPVPSEIAELMQRAQ